MKMKYNILTIVLLFSLVSQAQTIKWLVEPKYASITHYSNDIFKCIDPNGNLKLIDWSGQSIIIPKEADSITDYSDGYAIVLKGEEILGFLPEAKPHTFQSVGDGYYATMYSFFSEGYIAVAKGSAKGKQGYLDTKGNPVLECKYLEAMPVRKGWALVKENDKDCRYKQLEGSKKEISAMAVKGESLVWGTSFNKDGVALGKVRKLNGTKYVVFDTRFIITEDDKKVIGNKVDRENSYVNSYDYSYKSDESQEDNSPHNAKPEKNNDYRVYDKEGKKGYKSSVEEFVPAQFSTAEDFYDRRSIVSTDNGYGVIELLNGQFEPNWPEGRVRVYEYAKKADLLQFTLTPPASLERNNIEMEFDEGDGRFIVCNNLSRDFKVADQVIDHKSEECTLRAKATYTDNGFPDLLLWKDSKKVYIDYISVSLSSPVVTSEYADEYDNQTVKATVTNTSSIPVKVSATLNVAGKSTPFNGVLGSGQSQTIKVTVKVDDDKQVKATVSAKVDNHDCGNNYSYVSLKKI